MTPHSPWLLSLDEAEPWHGEVCDGLDVARCRGVWVAFHGWLDDAPVLAASLGVPRPATAAEVALSAFLKWGPQAPARLRGSFVLACADPAAREVIVARDAMGTHPLFHALARGRRAFSDTTAVLARCGEALPALNRAALADHLCHRWPDPEETFFEHVRRVPGGALARISGRRCSIERYWAPAPDDGPIDWIADDVPERFDHALTLAVDRSLAHGPAAVFLSGGLDSISVATRAADRSLALGVAPPRLLSLAMDDPACDERRTQSGVATALGLPFQLVEFDEAVGTRGLLAPALEVSASLSSPLLNTWAPAYLRLASDAAREGVRSILSGSGGDEWLSVSPYLSADLLGRGDVIGWWSFFRAFRRSYQHGPGRHALLAAWTFGGRPLASRAAARLFGASWQALRERRAVRHDPEWIAPDLALRRQQHARAAGALETASPAEGFYRRELTSGLRHLLTSWELEEQYEFGRRTRQRFVHPYWDVDLVDMLYRTPPSLLLKGGRAKGLVRGALAARLPGLGLDVQRKVAGTNYFRTLVDAGLGEAADRLGDCRTLADLGIISEDAARRYRWPDFGSAMTRWNVVNLEAWARVHV